MIIILLGPPGAGKGTQAKVLAKELGLAHISTGDTLRQNVSDGTDLGRAAKSYMDRGELVPDSLVTEMLSIRIDQADVRKGFILDGYPRNINQAKDLDEIFKQRDISVDLVFYLDASEPVIVTRLAGRLVCKDCGANFHVTNMPPKVKMACDNCGGALYQRLDDSQDTVKKRLEVYRKEASSLIQYYESQDKLHQLSADEEPNAILVKIIELVKRKNDSLKI